MALAKHRAVAAGAGPAVIEATQSAKVHTLGRPGALEALQPLGMDDRENAVGEPHPQRPRRRDRHPHERHPEHDCSDQGDRQADVGDGEVDAIERGDPGAPVGEAAFVLRVGINHRGWLPVVAISRFKRITSECSAALRRRDRPADRRSLWRGGRPSVIRVLGSATIR
jgi:hypothetical protein